MSTLPPLGSLAQSARSRQLKSARGILLFIGVLTVVVAGGMISLARSQVDNVIKTELDKIRAPGVTINAEKVEQWRSKALRSTYLMHGVSLALGVVFIVLGILVRKYPVPITITALVLYVGAGAIFGLIDPKSLAAGVVVKVIIILALVKSIQSALAYEREQAGMVDVA
jgi:hypothetical protein